MAQLAFDPFNRPDADNLGASWDVAAGATACRIVSERARSATTGTDSIETYNAVSLPVAQYCQGTVVTFTGSGTRIAAFGVRCSGPGSLDGYYGATTSSGHRIYKWTSGVRSTLVSDGVAAVAGEVIRIEAYDTALRLFSNGALILQTEDPTHTSGRGGLYIFAFNTSADVEVEEWEEGDLQIAVAHHVGGVQQPMMTVTEW